MFPSLKLYINQEIQIQKILSILDGFGYRRQEEIVHEGEFSRKGGIIDIWPLTFELPLRIEWEADRILTLRSIDLPTAKSFWDHTVVIILPVSKSRSGVTRLTHFKEDISLRNFLDIKFGDYVVHNRYGIGKFIGLEKIKIAQDYQDHIVIQYDRQEKLFVPVDQANLIQKYVAFGVRHPKLNRLGTKEWLRTKQTTAKPTN